MLTPTPPRTPRSARRLNEEGLADRAGVPWVSRSGSGVVSKRSWRILRASFRWIIFVIIAFAGTLALVRLNRAYDGTASTVSAIVKRELAAFSSYGADGVQAACDGASRGDDSDPRLDENPYYGVQGARRSMLRSGEDLAVSIVLSALFSYDKPIDMELLLRDAQRTSLSIARSTARRFEVFGRIARGCAERTVVLQLDRHTQSKDAFVEWALVAAKELSLSAATLLRCPPDDAASAQRKFELDTAKKSARGFLLTVLRIGDEFAPNLFEKAAWLLRVHSAADYVVIGGALSHLWRENATLTMTPSESAAALLDLAHAADSLVLFSTHAIRHLSLPAPSPSAVFCAPVELVFAVHFNLRTGVSLNEPLAFLSPDGAFHALPTCRGALGPSTSRSLLNSLSSLRPGMVGDRRLERSLASDAAARAFWTTAALPRGDQPLDFEPLFSRADIDVSRGKDGGTRKRNILVLLPWLVVGGADKVALDIIKGLTGADHAWSATILLSQKPLGAAGNEWLGRGRASTRQDDVFVANGHLPAHVYGELVCYLVRTRDIGALFISNAAAPYLFLPFIARYCPVGAVVDLNHNWVDEWIDGGFTTLSIGMQGYIDKSVYISRALREKMVENGADPEIGKVIHIGIDVDAFSRTAPRPPLPPPTLRILFVGRFSEEKRPALFPLAIAALIDRLRQSASPLTVHATMIGAGPEESAVRAAIRSLGVSVTLLGSLEGDELRHVAEQHDILLVTSRVEGTPLVAMEAMALGLAVVAPDVGGVGEIVCSECGHVVDVEAKGGLSGVDSAESGADSDSGSVSVSGETSGILSFFSGSDTQTSSPDSGADSTLSGADSDALLADRFASALFLVGSDTTLLRRTQAAAEQHARGMLDLRHTVRSVAKLFDEAEAESRHAKAGQALKREQAGQAEVLMQLTRIACNSQMIIRNERPLD